MRRNTKEVKVGNLKIGGNNPIIVQSMCNTLTKDIDIKKMAKDTQGYSGADIEALSREAALHAMRKNKETKEVTKKDFELAFNEIRPSVNEDMNKFYEEVVKKKRVQKMEEEISYTG